MKIAIAGDSSGAVLAKELAQHLAERFDVHLLSENPDQDS